MKKFTFSLLLILLIVSCKSPEKLLQQGDYDAVIDRQIKTILKGKAKNEDKVLFDKAYKLANQRDQERIDFLVKENRPENWEEIYRHYQNLDSRQAKVRKVLPLTISGRQINYPNIDYSNKIIEAKKNAAKYYYNRGMAQMDQNTKEGYRQAYFSFLRVNEFRPGDYPNLTTLINDCRYYGTSRVLVEIQNYQGFKLPRTFYDEISNIQVSQLNNSWTEFHLSRMDKQTVYDYSITIILKQVDVTPPLVENREYVRRKRVEDGFEYVLDQRGNVTKDSLGNDIKRPKYSNISCTVFEMRQTKSATVKADVEFMMLNPRRLLKVEPVAGTSVFDHISGRASGNRDALLPEDWDLIKREELPFPSNIDLIMNCAPFLRQAINDAIINNRNVIY